MKIIKVENYGEMSLRAGKVIWQHIKSKPDSVIVFPTGSTPEGMYSLFVERYNDGQDDWSKIIAFNLDEYIGIPKESITSYYSFMHNNFYDHINILPENIHIPNGEIDSKQSIQEFNKELDSVKQIDLVILGIGVNGHVGFNEPGTSIDSKFRVVHLSKTTIESNARNFSNKSDVPKKALSMGIANIMSAKKIILIASGRLKAKALEQMINGPITSDCPASFLQKHKNITIIMDLAAGIYV